ncbi:MAG: AAA family ATPase [Verrucomicrobiota bacterium]
MNEAAVLNDATDYLEAGGPDGQRLPSKPFVSTRDPDPENRQDSQSGSSGDEGQEKPKPKAFPHYFAGDPNDIPEDQPFVENLFFEKTFAVIYGSSAAGKSFWAQDLGMRTALGWRTPHGLRTHKTGVLYVPLEGVSGTFRRLEAFRLHRNPPERFPFVICHAPRMNLAGDEFDNSEELSLTIKETRKRAEDEFQVAFDWVIIDTLSRATSGADENSSSDMSRIIRVADGVRQTDRICFTYVHHSGKNQAAGARGHSSLRAATDTEIELTECNGDRCATVTKQKDAPPVGPFHFQIPQIQLGREDRFGNSITSCVVESIDEPSKPEKASKFVPLPDHVLAELPATGQIEKEVLISKLNRPSDDRPSIGRNKIDLLISEGIASKIFHRWRIPRPGKKAGVGIGREPQPQPELEECS